MDFLFNNSDTNPYLSVYTVGFEETKPNHNYGPARRSGYMLHYIYSGQGIFISNGKKYKLKKGDFFFISPSDTIQYISDSEQPWSYYWFGFRGKLADHYLQQTKIGQDIPVFSLENGTNIKKLMEHFIEISLISEDNDMLLNAVLLEILNYLNQTFLRQSSIGTRKNDILRAALSFIKNNYDTPIKINDVAQHLNIDRTYLHRLFASFLNKSPKQYLTDLRIERAQHLLTSTDLSINNIAYSCGFEDSSNFSKIFKKESGMTPKLYRTKTENLVSNKNNI